MLLLSRQHLPPLLPVFPVRPDRTHTNTSRPGPPIPGQMAARESFLWSCKGERRVREETNEWWGRRAVWAPGSCHFVNEREPWSPTPPPHLSQRGTKLYSRPNTMRTNTLPFTAVILYHEHGEGCSLIGRFGRSWTRPRRALYCFTVCFKTKQHFICLGTGLIGGNPT